MKFLKLLIIMVLLSGLSAHAQIFYKIEGNGLSAPSYILGTHHLAPVSVLDSITEFNRALSEVSAVVGELDMSIDPMTLGAKMQPYMLAPADSTISKLVDAETYSRLSSEFENWAPMPGMTLAMLDMMKPMVINTMVSVQMVLKTMPDFDPAKQLDTYIQTLGKEGNKQVIGLETPEFQAEVLYGAPISNQIKDLVEALDNPEKTATTAAELNEKYLAFDLPGLYQLSQQEDSDAAFMEALIGQRNDNWVKKLPEIMSEQPVLIAVGALHLPGEKGVLERLRKLGYVITPL